MVLQSDRPTELGATATWATSSFKSYWSQRLSLALQTGVAREILDAANEASAYRRAQ